MDVIKDKFGDYGKSYSLVKPNVRIFSPVDLIPTVSVVRRRLLPKLDECNLYDVDSESDWEYNSDCEHQDSPTTNSVPKLLDVPIHSSPISPIQQDPTDSSNDSVLTDSSSIPEKSPQQPFPNTTYSSVSKWLKKNPLLSSYRYTSSIKPRAEFDEIDGIHKRINSLYALRDMNSNPSGPQKDSAKCLNDSDSDSISSTSSDLTPDETISGCSRDFDNILSISRPRLADLDVKVDCSSPRNLKIGQLDRELALFDTTPESTSSSLNSSIQSPPSHFDRRLANSSILDLPKSHNLQTSVQLDSDLNLEDEIDHGPKHFVQIPSTASSRPIPVQASASVNPNGTIDISIQLPANIFENHIGIHHPVITLGNLGDPKNPNSLAQNKGLNASNISSTVRQTQTMSSVNSTLPSSTEGIQKKLQPARTTKAVEQLQVPHRPARSCDTAKNN